MPKHCQNSRKQGGKLDEKTLDEKILDVKIEEEEEDKSEESKNEDFSEKKEDSLEKNEDSMGADDGAVTDSNDNKPEVLGPEPKKQKRTWELWSGGDKDKFFEAVIESGRDFKKIHEILGGSKTKDQIRHLFYRTAQMIREQLGPNQKYFNSSQNQQQHQNSSTLLQTPNLSNSNQQIQQNLTKHEQDTLLIVSFAEMRDKLGSSEKLGSNDNFLIKHKRYKSNLSELVRDGVTKFKHRGTVHKVRRKVNSNQTGMLDEDENSQLGYPNREDIQTIIKQILMKNSAAISNKENKIEINKLKNLGKEKRRDSKNVINSKLPYKKDNISNLLPKNSSSKKSSRSTPVDEVLKQNLTNQPPNTQTTSYVRKELASHLTEQHILPLMIPVELFPLDYSTLSRIQQLHQNSRIRIEIPGDVNLIDLMEFLEKKWHQEVSVGVCHGMVDGVKNTENLNNAWKPSDRLPNDHNGQNQTKIAAYPYFEFVGTLRSGGAILSDIKVVRQKDKLVIVGRAADNSNAKDDVIRWNRVECSNTTIAEVALRVGAMGKPAAVRIQYTLNLARENSMKKRKGPMFHFLNLANTFNSDSKKNNLEKTQNPETSYEETSFNRDSLPNLDQNSNLPELAPKKTEILSNQPRTPDSSDVLPVTVPGKRNKKPQQFKIIKKVDLIDAGVNTDIATEKFMDMPKNSVCKSCSSTMSANDIISNMKSGSRNNVTNPFVQRTVPTLKRSGGARKHLTVVKRVKKSVDVNAANPMMLGHGEEFKIPNSNRSLITQTSIAQNTVKNSFVPISKTFLNHNSINSNLTGDSYQNDDFYSKPTFLSSRSNSVALPANQISISDIAQSSLSSLSQSIEASKCMLSQSTVNKIQTIFQSPMAGSSTKEIINLASILASPSKLGLEYMSPVKLQSLQSDYNFSDETSNMGLNISGNSVDKFIRELTGPKRILFDNNADVDKSMKK